MHVQFAKWTRQRTFGACRLHACVTSLMQFVMCVNSGERCVATVQNKHIEHCILIFRNKKIKVKSTDKTYGGLILLIQRVNTKRKVETEAERLEMRVRTEGSQTHTAPPLYLYSPFLSPS